MSADAAAPHGVQADHVAGDAWELSKENVLPIRRGRKVATLAKALAPAEPGCGKSRLQDLKRQFEAELATQQESGDPAADEADVRPADSSSDDRGATTDPLDTWLRYIRAVQDECPSDQTEHFALLERCARQFRTAARYRNDPRYLKVWIAYADQLSNSAELFSFLYKNAIGVELALFWVAWAWVAETRGDYSLADKLYTKGTARRAEPVETVKRRHQEFMRRMSRKWLAQQEEESAGGLAGSGGSAGGSSSPRRGALESLSRAAVARNRRGAASGSARPAGLPQGEVTGVAAARRSGLGAPAGRAAGGSGSGSGSGRNAGAFAVFVEEEFAEGRTARREGSSEASAAGGRAGNDRQMEGSSSGGGWADFGTRELREKENSLAPLRWTEGALGPAHRRGTAEAARAPRSPGRAYRRGGEASSSAAAAVVGRSSRPSQVEIFVDEGFREEDLPLPAAAAAAAPVAGAAAVAGRATGAAGAAATAAEEASRIGLVMRGRIDGPTHAERLARDPLRFMRPGADAAPEPLPLPPPSQRPGAAADRRQRLREEQRLAAEREQVGVRPPPVTAVVPVSAQLAAVADPAPAAATAESEDAKLEAARLRELNQSAAEAASSNIGSKLAAAAPEEFQFEELRAQHLARTGRWVQTAPVTAMAPATAAFALAPPPLAHPSLQSANSAAAPRGSGGTGSGSSGGLGSEEEECTAQHALSSAELLRDAASHAAAGHAAALRHSRSAKPRQLSFGPAAAAAAEPAPIAAAAKAALQQPLHLASNARGVDARATSGVTKASEARLLPLPQLPPPPPPSSLDAAEADDRTINTKVALQELNDLFSSDSPGGDGRNWAAAAAAPAAARRLPQDGAGGASDGSKVFEDPDGSLSLALTRQDPLAARQENFGGGKGGGYPGEAVEEGDDDKENSGDEETAAGADAGGGWGSGRAGGDDDGGGLRSQRLPRAHDNRDASVLSVIEEQPQQPVGLDYTDEEGDSDGGSRSGSRLAVPERRAAAAVATTSTAATRGTRTALAPVEPQGRPRNGDVLRKLRAAEAAASAARRSGAGAYSDADASLPGSGGGVVIVPAAAGEPGSGDAGVSFTIFDDSVLGDDGQADFGSGGGGGPGFAIFDDVSPGGSGGGDRLLEEGAGNGTASVAPASTAGRWRGGSGDQHSDVGSIGGGGGGGSRDFGGGFRRGSSGAPPRRGSSGRFEERCEEGDYDRDAAAALAATGAAGSTAPFTAELSRIPELSREEGDDANSSLALQEALSHHDRSSSTLLGSAAAGAAGGTGHWSVASSGAAGGRRRATSAERRSGSAGRWSSGSHNSLLYLSDSSSSSGAGTAHSGDGAALLQRALDALPSPPHEQH